MQIDYERDRKLLGLPPKAPLLPGAVKAVLAAGLVMLGAIVAGGLTHALAQTLSGGSLEQLQRQLRRAQTPEDIRRLALEIRNVAPDTSLGRLEAARALEYAADSLPEQKAWQQEALSNLRAARDAGLPVHITGQERILAQLQIGMQISGLLLNLGHDRQAKEELEALRAAYGKEEAWYDAEENYTNLLAYILSSAADPAVRNGRESLRRMNTIMRGSERNQSNAAYMDTWAECNFAAGRPHKAMELQRKALALASGHDLWVYVEHYRKYRDAAAKTAADLPDPDEESERRMRERIRQKGPLPAPAEDEDEGEDL